MPDPKTSPKPAKPAAPELAEATGLTPASETTNPEVQQLLAELQTLRTNGATDDAQDIVTYLAELGYSA